jgi:hypothetical protein
MHSLSARRVQILLFALSSRILGVSVPVLCGRLSYTTYFHLTHKKVSGGERTGDLEGQFTGPRRPSLSLGVVALNHRH